MAEVRATPVGLFSGDFVVADGAFASRLSNSRWRERGSFTLSGREYRIARDGWLGPFLLLEDGATAASAAKPSAWFRRFVVSIGARTVELAARSPFSNRFAVREDGREDGREIGAVEPAGWFSRTVTARLPDDLPGHARVFLVWLVLMLHRRASNQNSAS